MAHLADAGVALSGRRAVVVGRSILVGKPMALMLQAADATVSMAHACTCDLAELTRQAEVLVVAAGRPGMIGAEHVSAGAVEPIASAITQMPGGVGPMTVAMLLVNTVVAWCRRYGIAHGLEDLLP